MTKMEEFSVNNSEEFEKMVEKGDIRIAKALVGTILSNLKGRKRHIPALSVFLEEEELVLDVTVDRQDFIYVLETNLPKFEVHELYEECAEIVKAIKYLKETEDKKKK
jgi:hypothetical protein